MNKRYTRRQFLPAIISRQDALPWMPSETPGKSSKPLRFLPDNRGFVELLRMEPGTLMPLHRHSGEIHAYNLSGARQLCTGERIGPGEYVYEPAGNTDWWKVVGEQTLIALVIVNGEVEFLGTGGKVLHVASASTQFEACRRHCEHLGVAMPDLTC